MAGFRKMDPERRKEVARKGGLAAHKNGRAHAFTSETARVAGQKGGQKVAKDRKYMSELGKRGAAKRAENRARERAILEATRG